MYNENGDIMNLYVIRHGETYANANGLYNGRIDDTLNEKGIIQAKNLISHMENLDVDLIICSPMVRTKKTCEIINVNNIKVIYDDRIIERDPGSLNGKKLSEYDREEFWNYFSDRKSASVSDGKIRRKPPGRPNRLFVQTRTPFGFSPLR